jgi:hypothetical protein
VEFRNAAVGGTSGVLQRGSGDNAAVGGTSRVSQCGSSYNAAAGDTSGVSQCGSGYNAASEGDDDEICVHYSNYSSLINHAPREGTVLPYLPDDNIDWAWEPEITLDPAIKPAVCPAIHPAVDSTVKPAIYPAINPAVDQECMPMQLMTDYTLACHNAVRNIWPFEIIFGMCGIHAWKLWYVHHTKKFKNKDANVTLMGLDFEAYHISPCPALIPLLCSKMMAKWSSIYKESDVANAWYKQWCKTIHTRSQLNQTGMLCGGLPAHNNGVEGINNGDKVAFDNRKPVTVEFVGLLVDEIATKSRINLLFHEKNLHADVHSNSFYQSVHSFCEATENGIATFLNVKFPFVDQKLGLQTGSMLVALTSFLAKNDACRKTESCKQTHSIPQLG